MISPQRAIFAIVFLLALCAVSPHAFADRSIELFLQLGHSGWVLSVAFSPDGMWLASGSEDQTVKLWEVRSGELVRTLSGHSGWVWSVAFSPDGMWLASGSEDQTVKLWEVRSGELVRTLSGHTGRVRSVAFSPDGMWLASGSEDQTVKLWEVRSGELVHTLSGHTGPVWSVAFSPDGTRLASDGQDRTVKLWEVRSGELVRTLSGHTGPVLSVAFSPDGTQLASGSQDQTVKLWEVRSGELVRTLSGHSGWVWSVAFSPDGTQLASGSEDQTVKLWEVRSGELVRTLSGHTSWVWSVAFSPDGTRLASGGQDRTVKLWEVRSGELVRTLSGHTGPVWSVAFSPDGTRLASGGQDQTVKLWEVRSGELVRTLSGHTGPVWSVAFSPDGARLASDGQDRTVKLWEVRSGELVHTLSGHTGPVWSVAFSPDGTRLASGSEDQTVKLWEVRSGELVRTLSGHTGWVWSVAFSPDGTRLASGSEDQTVKLWEVRSGELVRTLSGHTGRVRSVAFSPDGMWLASGSEDQTVKLWEVRSGELVHTLSGHTGPVRSVAFSPDGMWLASGSEDQTVKLWEVRSGELVHTLSGHTGPVRSVAFSPDGTRLASGSLDGTINIWEIVSGAIKVSMALLPGNEWLAYHPEKWVYNSSRQGDEYAAIRFDHQLSPVYPLRYYRQELKRADLEEALWQTQPVIEPMRFRLWWDHLNKAFLFGGLLLGLLTGATGVTVAIVLRKRSDPMEVAKQFFARAGFQRVGVISRDLLLLNPKDDQMACIVTLWPEGQSDLSEHLLTTIRQQRERCVGQVKLYIVYKEQGPSSSIIHAWRGKLACEIIPLLSTILQKTLSTDDCERLLKELEEPYLARIDPYAESKPIHDPTWFYGRDELLKRLPAMLAQGQHVGIFGLRKVGKTSLINQLRQRFVTTPTVFIDCQAFSARAEIFFEEILKQLQTELRAYAVKGIPARLSTVDVEGFRQQFLTFYELWEKTGQRGPFVIILDEIDKLFPNQEVKNSEEILAEYVRFFRLLRGLAQSRQCLVTLVIAYRPDVNRRNLLTSAVGENPMFQSFREEYLGYLDPDDSAAMIREIGRWKQIEWDENAARRVFDYCGGHPLITRFFASHACEEGALKTIDYLRVEGTAEEIQATLRRHEIGNYYHEGIWELLRDGEQQVLRLICERGQAGFQEAQIPRDLEDALTNVERFGLVASHGDSLYLTARLFHVWLERRITS